MKDHATDIIRTLQNNGNVAVFCGGAVRDPLMNRTPKDWDVATSAVPSQVIELYPHSVLDGIERGVVGVITPAGVVDVATLRKDGSYSDGRRPDSVEFTHSLEEDARRRDFTINAMFLDPISGELHDFHDGQSDIRRRVVKTVGTPDDRFREDALRMLRAVRFTCQLGFVFDRGIQDSCVELSPLVHGLSGERVWAELSKILMTNCPENGISLLRSCGILDKILPEVADLYGLRQDPIHHREGDVWGHTLLALVDLQIEGADLETRFAGLLHDIGKKTCCQFRLEDGVERISNIGHDLEGANMAEQVCKRLKLSNDQTQKITGLVRLHMRAHNGPKMRKSKLIQMMRHPDFDCLVQLQHADSMGALRPEKSNREFYRSAQQTLDISIKATPLVGGKDLINLGLKPGPEFRRILDSIREAQDDGLISTREEAIAMVKESDVQRDS